MSHGGLSIAPVTKDRLARLTAPDARVFGWRVIFDLLASIALKTRATLGLKLAVVSTRPGEG